MDKDDSNIESSIKQNIVDQFTVAGFNPHYYYPRESDQI